MFWFSLLGGLAVGSAIGIVAAGLKNKRDLNDSVNALKNQQDIKVDEIDHELQMKRDQLEEKEHDKTEKAEDAESGRRHNQSKRRRTLSRLQQDVQRKEREIDNKFRKNNNKRRHAQRLQKSVRRQRSDLFKIHDEQKEQIIEKLGINKDEMIQDILTNLEKQVTHERQLWAEHQIGDIEHLGNEVAADLVDTLVCRLQLKPTVKPQENKINIPDKEPIKEAFVEGSPIIQKIQDLCHVELIFNEERTDLRVSAYDGVAREIALRLINRMLQNWKGQDNWFEDQVPQITNRLEREMTRGCGDLLRRLRLDDVPIEVVRMQGRLRFRTSYGQNVLDHVLESAYLGGMMASELELNGKMGRRSSFLHDVGKAIDVEQEGSHPELGGEFLVEHEEAPEVAHAAAKHHSGYNPLHLYTALAKSADAMSGGRPGARRESIDNYVERVQSLESIAKRPDGVLSVSITQAGRDIQINVDPKKISDDKLQEISDTVAADIQKELTYPGEIKVSAVREIWTKQVAH